jgi:hypothetical protein
MTIGFKAFQTFIVGAILSLTGSALAATGVVSGNFKIWNKNGSFCDSALQDCTGAAYSKSQFDNIQPYRNGRVEVWRGSTVIGQGQSDGSGNFSVTWTSGSLTNAFVRFFAQDKDNHFFIADTNGLRMNTNTPTFTLTAGTTAGSPQNVGSYADAGSSAAATWYNNLYWGAALEWTNAFSLSGALAASYNGVEVRGVAATMNNFLGSCPTSCATGVSKRVQIDSVGSAFSPQGRIMHESGHVANYLLKPYHGTPGTNAYCWDTADSTSPVPPATSCSWSRNSPEWGVAAFEEALATFSADNTLWYPNAVDPTSCTTQGRCSNTSTNRIEETHYAYDTNSCDVTDATPESRWPISGQRLLWDIYDDHDDADGDTVAEGAGAFWHMYANMTTYATGVADHAIDEPWSSTSYTTVTKWDGRGMSDYAVHYGTNYTSVGTLSVDNCSPY